MQEDKTLQALGVDPRDDAWADWDQSSRQWQLQAERLLLPHNIRSECRWLGMDRELEEVFASAAGEIGNNERLMRLFWHGHWVLSQPQEYPHRRRAWPMLPDHHGEPGRMIYALVCLSCVEQTRKRNAHRGIDEALTRQTLSDLSIWVRHYRKERGTWGFSQLFWLTGHLTGELYQLGRLQFQMARFPHDFHLLRSVEDGHTILLAGQGMRFRGDGQFDSADGVVDPAGAWVATYREAQDVITGYPITPQGAARREMMSLNARQWKPVLSQGGPILEIHIQAGRPMDQAACDESFRRANEFFPTLFPEHPFVALTCESWLMDSQLEQALAPGSNIVHFLRRFHRYPLANASDHQTMERVFGAPTVDWRRAPQNTTLQRSIVAHMNAGGRWRDAGGIIPRQGNPGHAHFNSDLT